MPAGRPSKYQDSYPRLAYEFALLGKTDEELAIVFGVNPDTIYEWDRVHPEFSETRARGKEIADAKVAASLYNRAIGYEHEAVKIFMPAGFSEPVYAPYTERFAPDVAAASLWLSNRQGGRWKLKSATQQLDRDGNPTDPVAPVLNVTVARE